MLVLSRRPTESIVFPPTGIGVQVLDVRGATVKLGVSAPDDVKILRAEVYARDPRIHGRGAAAPVASREPLEQLRSLLHLYRGQRDLGRPDEAELTLQQAITLLEGLQPAPTADPSEPSAAAPATSRIAALRV